MSNLKYWYIDDENGFPEETTVRMFQHHEVNVELFSLKDRRDFGTLKKDIIKLTKEEDFGGLILDLYLDGAGDYSTEFNATALAQELRSIAARGDTPIYPIVLTSSVAKMKETYNNDKTSHDLFDYKIYKNSENWDKRGLKLNSLAEEYKAINVLISSKGKADSLNNLNSFIESLFDRKVDDIRNTRLREKLLELASQNDKHFIANFIIKQMFHFSNPLINKRILFAKLGLFYDEVSLPDRIEIYELFKGAKYSGVFSKGWERWWEDDISEIIKEQFNLKFGFIPASKRVEALNNKLNTNLVSANVIEHCFSDEYSVICEATKRPLDHLEGFKIQVSHDYLPWQTYKYMSLYEVLNRSSRSTIKPHPSELDRIKRIKKDTELK